MTQQPVEGAAAADKAGALGFTVRARTQGEIVRRRFFRHRGAMAGLTVFAFIVLLAFTSNSKYSWLSAFGSMNISK